MTHHNSDRIFEIIKYLFDLAYTKQDNRLLDHAFRFLEQYFIQLFELNPDPIKNLETVQRAKQLERERNDEEFNERLNKMMKLNLMKSIEMGSHTNNVPQQLEAIKQVMENMKPQDQQKSNPDPMFLTGTFTTSAATSGQQCCKTTTEEKPKIEVVESSSCCNKKNDFQILDKVTSGDYTSLAILQRQKDRVDLNKVGLVSGVYPSIASPEVRTIQKSVMEYAVAQAILDNIGTIENNLVVRDLFPDIDLLDGEGRRITNRRWIQYNKRADKPCTRPLDAQAVYTTGKDCNNERKIIIIWGFENLGNSRVNSIIMKRAEVKTIDVIDSSNLEFAENFNERVRVLKTPIMYRRGDNVRVEFIFDDYIDYTEIRPLGIVVEALGQTMVG